MRTTVNTLLILSIFALALSGCLLHEEGTSASVETDEYTTESSELSIHKKGIDEAMPAHKKTSKIAVEKIKPASQAATVIEWFTDDVDVQEASVNTGSCSNSSMAGMACSGNNGNDGFVSVPGPDGGTCTYTGTYQNCTMQNVDMGRCCVCEFVVSSRAGDCESDGSTTSFQEIEYDYN